MQESTPKISQRINHKYGERGQSTACDVRELHLWCSKLSMMPGLRNEYSPFVSEPPAHANFHISTAHTEDPLLCHGQLCMLLASTCEPVSDYAALPCAYLACCSEHRYMCLACQDGSLLHVQSPLALFRRPSAMHGQQCELQTLSVASSMPVHLLQTLHFSSKAHIDPYRL